MSPLRAEIRKMAVLGLPVAATQLGVMLIGFVDTVMVGHVSVEALGAVALAWLGTERFLLLAGQDPELARIAHAFTLVQIPGIPFFLIYNALRQYLQGREQMRAALWVILAANLCNALFAWALIFGHLGAPPLGVVGAGLAATLTRVVSCLGLVAWTRAFALHEDAWVPWSRDSLRWDRIARVATIGLPVAMQVSLEMWAFSGAALIAGRLGAVSLAAHTIALKLAALAFMLPLGIAQGAATRVGNLIGAREPDAAQRAAWVSIGMGAGVMTLSASLFVVFRTGLPRLYTPDADVILACAAILPIAAAFQIFDGTQAVGCGILRGMGRTRPAMVFNLVSYWVLGLPIGAWLALFQGWGLAGIWWGLALGLGLVATSLVLWVRVRGPAIERDGPSAVHHV